MNNCSYVHSFRSGDIVDIKELCQCPKLDPENQAPNIETLYDLAELFKVFGDSTRIRILSALSHRELCVQDLAGVLDMQQSAISHQLRTLRQAALVKPRRDGRVVYYSLDDEHVDVILSMGLEHIDHKRGEK